MTRIALFGHKGYLGGQLAYYLLQKGICVDGYDMPESDITSATFWDVFQPSQYAAIFFFSGVTGTEVGFERAAEYVAVNEIGLLNLLVKISTLGISAPKVVFPSTRLVYEGSERLLAEESAKDAKTVYAVNKLACENFLKAYHNRFGIPYAVVRICVPYGNLISCDYSYGTIGFFLKQAAAGRIILYGGGVQRRTFTHVSDICEAVFRLAGSEKNGVYNIGGENLTLCEVAKMIASLKRAEVAAVPWPESALKLESGSTCFCASKLDAAVGKLEYKRFSSLVKEL